MDNNDQQTDSSAGDSFKIDNLKKPKYFEGIDRDHKLSLPDKEPGSSKKTLILILILLLIVGGIGGFFFYNFRASFKAPSFAPTPTPSATPAPTQAPKVLDRSQWSLEVLNGSGIAGEAKRLADKLIELGYPVVKTGNADKSTYETTQFLVKEEMQADVDLMVADIKDIIKIASMSGQLEDSTASARIIIGKNIQ